MSVDPEIFAIFQHKVERIPHFTRVTEVRHMFNWNHFAWYSFYLRNLMIKKDFKVHSQLPCNASWVYQPIEEVCSR